MEQNNTNAFAEFEKKERRQYKTGRIILLVIAGVELLSSIVSCFFDFNILQLLCGTTLAAALYFGVTWVRYLYAVGAGLAALQLLYTLFVLWGGFLQGDLVWEWKIVLALVITAVQLAYHIAVAIILFTNKAVKEFLYEQKNG